MLPLRVLTMMRIPRDTFYVRLVVRCLCTIKAKPRAEVPHSSLPFKRAQHGIVINANRQSVQTLNHEYERIILGDSWRLDDYLLGT